MPGVVAGEADPVPVKRDAGEHQPVERQDSRHNNHQGAKHRLAKTNSGQGASDKPVQDKKGVVASTTPAPVSASNNTQRPGKRTERPKSPQVGQK